MPETLYGQDPKPRVLRPNGKVARDRDALPGCQVSGLLRKALLLFLEVYDVFQLPALFHWKEILMVILAQLLLVHPVKAFKQKEAKYLQQIGGQLPTPLQKHVPERWNEDPRWLLPESSHA